MAFEMGGSQWNEVSTATRKRRLNLRFTGYNMDGAADATRVAVLMTSFHFELILPTVKAGLAETQRQTFNE